MAGEVTVGGFFAARGPYGLNDVGITACRVRIGGGLK